LRGFAHAFLWQNGRMIDLGTPPGARSGPPGVTVTGINDPGQVVANVVTASGFTHAVLWQNGRMIDLGTPPAARAEGRWLTADG
jgi:probable HAF family extracellular repeat protein